ncbi:MAG: metallophosphoesterase [Oscillospiraceae bacterium]|nr:metallophosphoesterase [Oscillospiraceae bacterium]
MISFVHLSDIHFTKWSKGSFDIDSDLRNEIILDIKHNFAGKINNPYGILICGDIAFSGQEREYNSAIQFINEICNVASILENTVFCVPGNHDIDQNIPKSKPTVKAVQDSLAGSKGALQYDDQFIRFLSDDESARLLYEPLHNYNTFAQKYNCHYDIGHNAHSWKHNLKLTDTYSLCIVGLNSTFISNADDHATPNERLMKMSSIQIPQRRDNTIFLTLCHHPPECWDDADQSMQNTLNERIHLQLYGHKHTQSIKRTKKGLIINSGATHPSRWEPDWIPRYNWISLDIESKEDGHDYLLVIIHPRIYSPGASAFEQDASLSTKEYLEYSFDLGNSNQANTNHELAKTDDLKNNGIADSSTTDNERLLYDFINLPIERRNTILKKLKLCRDEDISKSHAEILHDIISRAKEARCLQALVEEVNKYKQ